MLFKIKIKLPGICLLFLILFYLIGCSSHSKELIEAIEQGNIDTVNELIKEGAKLNSKSYEYQPLEAAIKNDKDKIAEILIKNGADVNWLCSDERTPLQFAFEKANENDNWNIFEILIKNKADVNIKVKYFSSFMDEKVDNQLSFWAAVFKKEDYVKLLIDNELDLDYHSGKTGSALLHLAVFHLSSEIIKYMVSHGADVNIQNKDGRNPFSLAICEGFKDKAKLFIELGTDVHAGGYGGTQLWTELAYYWEDGYQEIAELLLQKGLNFMGEDFWGLHAAARFGRYEYTKWLLEHGADVNRKDHEDKLPIDLTYKYSMNVDGEPKDPERVEIVGKIVDLLESYGSE